MYTPRSKSVRFFFKDLNRRKEREINGNGVIFIYGKGLYNLGRE
jgi:hypothetical protein